MVLIHVSIATSSRAKLTDQQDLVSVLRMVIPLHTVWARRRSS